MRTFFFSVVLLALPILITAQDCESDENPIPLVFTYDEHSKKLELNKSVGDLVSGCYYTVRINGLNSSVFKAELTEEFFFLDSKSPEILKGILNIEYAWNVDQNLSEMENFTGDEINTKSNGKSPLDKLKNEAIRKFDNLENFLIKADSLYETTKFVVSNGELANFWNRIDTSYSNYRNKPDSLYKKLTEDVFFITSVKNLFAELAKPDSANSEAILKILDDFSELQYISLKASQTNYVKYATFAISSENAKDHITGKPFQAKKDGVDLKITLVDEVKKDTVYSGKREFLTKGFWKFDFSSGFFGNSLNDQNYYLVQRDTMTNAVIQEDNYSSDNSIGGMAHLSYKFSSFVKAGFSLGAALSPFDQQVRYMLGGSMILGRKAQFALNAGACFMNQKRLSGKVQQDDLGVQYLDKDVTEIPTFRKPTVGGYFGISYIIPTKKK